MSVHNIVAFHCKLHSSPGEDDTTREIITNDLYGEEGYVGITIFRSVRTTIFTIRSPTLHQSQEPFIANNTDDDRDVYTEIDKPVTEQAAPRQENQYEYVATPTAHTTEVNVSTIVDNPAYAHSTTGTS